MNEIETRDIIISHLTDGYVHLYKSFNELVAEFTTLLITINGASYFETDTENKVKMAGEAALILQKKNKIKQVEVIREALIEYHNQL